MKSAERLRSEGLVRKSFGIEEIENPYFKGDYSMTGFAIAKTRFEFDVITTGLFDLFKARHNVYDILIQYCFIFAIAFATYFIILCGGALETGHFVTFSEMSKTSISKFMELENLLINILSFLICIEISQSFINGYFDYRRDNL